jgi:hypothetical protein
MNARSLAGALAVVVLAFGTLLPAACHTVDKCAENGTPCGGNPVGQWTLASSCQDPALANTAVAKRTYVGQPITTMGERAPEPTSTDWCADLIYDGPAQGIIRLNLPHDTSEIIGGYLYYLDDFTYGAFITNTAITSIDFSQTCITRFGSFPTCSEFSAAFGNFARLQGGIKLPPGSAADATAPDFCTDDGSGGCRCNYVVEADAAGSNLTGTWNASGTVLTHFEGSMVLPSQVDYCADGDRLTLWGHARTNVLDVVGAPGARTLSFTRIVCGNGVKEHGEDCDPPDGTTCDMNCRLIVTP